MSLSGANTDTTKLSYISKRNGLALLIFLMGHSFPFAVNANIGTVVFTKGKVTIQGVAASPRRTASRGMALDNDDTVLTGENGLAQIRLNGGSLIALRSQSTLQLGALVNTMKSLRQPISVEAKNEKTAATVGKKLLRILSAGHNFSDRASSADGNIASGTLGTGDTSGLNIVSVIGIRGDPQLLVLLATAIAQPGTIGFPAIVDTGAAPNGTEGSAHQELRLASGRIAAADGSTGIIVIDPETGLAWGRYDQVIGNNGQTLADGQPVHFIYGSRVINGESRPVVPLTGSQQFVLLGHSGPTRNDGAVGTISNANLTANFDNHSVQTTIIVDFPQDNQHWQASGSAALPGSSPIAARVQPHGFIGEFDSVEINGRMDGTGSFAGFIEPEAATPGAALTFQLQQDATSVAGAAALTAAPGFQLGATP